MKKKVLSILMTAMMALSLAACGSTDNSTTPADGTDSQSATAESVKTEAEAPAGEQTLKGREVGIPTGVWNSWL